MQLTLRNKKLPCPAVSPKYSETACYKKKQRMENATPVNKRLTGKATDE